MAAVLLGCALLLIGVSEISEAQQRKTTIYLECPAKDRVGQSLCFRVKEQLRKSASFSLALDHTDAFVRVRIHSVDKDTPPTGNASSVAVILTLAQDDSYLHDQILFVGRNAVETAAVGIVAGIDEYLDQLFRDAARESRQPRAK
jgi:hypothetical protein